MPNSLKTYIDNLILTVKKDVHIFPIKWDNETYWVKRPQPIKPTIWHQIQKVINIILPLDIIKTTVAQNASESLAQEISHSFKEIEQHHILGPRLVTASAHWLCMTDAGTTLHELLEKDKCPPEILLKAAEKLAELHEKNLCHGRAKLNDLTLMNKEEIGFIDFEENPLKVMPLAAAQDRDLYLFVSSICRWDSAIASEALAIYKTKRSEGQTYKALKSLLFLTKPIKLLKPFIHKMSKDIRQAYFAQQVFESSMQPNPRN